MATIELSPTQPFNLDQTLDCGQVFRWEWRDGWWYGVVDDRVIKIRQEGTNLTYEGAEPTFIRQYFQLDLDLSQIIKSFDRDPFIHAAVEKCHGLRLVSQPRWECTISYICATNSNIPMIKRRIALLARTLGKEITFEGCIYYTFPGPEAIADCCNSALKNCKMGYRAQYVLDTACELASMYDWEQTTFALPYEDARRKLMQLSGIGPKAADCILLFAFQKYESFPVDVWIRRIINEHYLKIDREDPQRAYGDYDRIRKFARQYFGQYCGYAQEYLFGSRLK
jgi:N-glycosylase/DNA lyase